MQQHFNRPPWWKDRDRLWLYGGVTALALIYLVMRLMQEHRVDDYLILPVR